MVILDRLYEKYAHKEINIKEIKHQMNRVNRIPKNVLSIIIAEMINSKYLIKQNSNYKVKLRSNIKTLIDSNMEKYNIIRNKTFT